MSFSHTTAITCCFQVSHSTRFQVKPHIDVSFACPQCQRVNRTVVFEELGQRGICTPQKKCSGFPGALTSLTVSDTEHGKKAQFLIEYDYADFYDTKLGIRAPKGASWARVRFYILCSNCKKLILGSTQTNRSRPSRTVCACGDLLLREQSDPFTFENH